MSEVVSLDPATGAALRDLILSLADNKRLLGIRYSDWMLGAPTLETGIAASSMAQDEWGHGRLTYALLSDLGEDPRHLEHERESEQYHSMELLDSRLGSWLEVIAVVLVIDTALTVHYGALAESRYAPVRNRVEKLLDEEAFHFQYAVGWAQRLAESALREEFREAIARLLPLALRWLGAPDSGGAARLESEGIVREGPEGLRARYLQCVGPVLGELGLATGVGLAEGEGAWRFDRPLSWSGWDATRRRGADGGPDADTLARVRGDKNRAVLLD